MPMTSVQRRWSPGPDRLTRAPREMAPPGACDTHFHIYGPQQRFPLLPARTLEVEDCTLDDALKMHDILGLTRGVVVQSFQHGFSYEYMLHALSREPQRLRGIITPSPDITDRELAMLSRAGVVGARFTPLVTPRLDMRTIDRLCDRQWHMQFFVRGLAQIETWRGDLLGMRGNFVLDHAGFPPTDKGIDSAEFRFVMDCLDTGRCWIKLTPRFSAHDNFPFSDVGPFIDVLVRHAPERLLWGTDWPHPEYFKPMPNDGDLLDLLLDWIPDAPTRRKILVENPAGLFQF